MLENSTVVYLSFSLSEWRKTTISLIGVLERWLMKRVQSIIVPVMSTKNPKGKYLPYFHDRV